MKLNPTLDLNAAAPLLSDLQRARGAGLELDGSEVERVGGLCLQVLLAARAAWAADGQAFRIANPSEAFAEGLRRMGAGDLANSGDLHG